MPKCDTCEKDFDSEEALQQHSSAKHGSVQKKKGSKKWIVVGVVIILIIIGASAAFLSKPSYTPSARTEHVVGTGDVAIVEYSDFQCPACGATYPEVKKFLENNTDNVIFTYKHFPLTSIHPYAFKAAEASECAADQSPDAFWPYHDKLFENQNALSRTDLIRYADSIGLDKDKFTKCLDSGVMAERVNSDMSDARSKGVRATPTFFINGKKTEGGLTAEQFEQEVNRA